MNEGKLGSFSFSGEALATGDHPAVIDFLPIADSVTTKLDVGVLLKKVDITETTGESGSQTTTTVDICFAPITSTDADTVYPVAVINKPFDPTGTTGDTHAQCVVHGTVKSRLLKLSNGTAPTVMVLARMKERGIYPA